MMTVRRPHRSWKGEGRAGTEDDHTHEESPRAAGREEKLRDDEAVRPASKSALIRMTILSFVVFGLGIAIAVTFGGL